MLYNMCMALKLNHDKNYLKFIENSIGTHTFRNLYMVDDTLAEFDAANNGQKSCALFVTGILKMYNRIDNLHSTALGTMKYITESNDWSQTSVPAIGDLIYWDKTDITTGHVGFYMGENTAISNSDQDGFPVKHTLQLKDGRNPVSFWHFNSK